ncbi:MAG TPA: hypothetical protein VGC44_15140, partial [Longimicrobiales bacterium]
EAEKILPFLIGTVGGYYGLMTGFILSIAWGDVQSVRNSSMVEINALADLDRIALTLPAPVGPQLHYGVTEYLRSVIDHDVQALSEGRVSRETTAAYGRLWSLVAGARRDANPWEASLLGRALDKVGVVGEQRRVRILISTETFPSVVWAILLLGAVIVLTGSTIVSLRYGPPAREVMMAVAAMLSIVLFAIYAMDRPYRHGYGPGSARYETLWKAFNVVERQNPITPTGISP